MKRAGVVAVAAAGLIVGLLFGPNAAVGTHEPADRVSASGSSTEVAGPGEQVVIMSETVRTSATSDLLLEVTAECSLITNLTTIGNDSERAFGQVKVWVEIDGIPVPVAENDADAGKVVFCNRAYQRDTLNFDDEDATIKTFLETRTATGFNWLALNVGSGIHVIEVKAELTEQATSDAVAEAVIGNRTLVVQPVKAATHEAVTELG